MFRGVEPAVFDAVLGGPVELRGEGFWPSGSLDFDQPKRSAMNTDTSAEVELGGSRVELADVVWLDSTRIAATVPGGLKAGLWSVHLVTPRGERLTLPDALEVRARLPDGGLPDGGPDVDAGADAGVDAGEDAGVDAGEDAGFDAGPQPCQTLTFEDFDEDGFGAADSGALLCGPGRVQLTGDCNDLDSLASPVGVELCNGLDDDCDGTIDPGCPDGGFLRSRDGGGNLLSVSAWGPEQVWIAGARLLAPRRERHLHRDGDGQRARSRQPRRRGDLQRRNDGAGYERAQRRRRGRLLHQLADGRRARRHGQLRR